MSKDIYTAAQRGDAEAVRRFLAADPSLATAAGGPDGWDALTCLCFSETSLGPGRLDAARALLEAGASANTGYFERGHQPNPEWESVLYAAAGRAFDAELTRLLLDHGADPNDGETPYHSPETYHLGALQALVESGRCTADTLATMLLRKADWHHYEGVVYLLEHGADPNRRTHWGHTALQQAVRRDNDLAIIEAMLDHGADGRSILSLAARRGRGDVLDAVEERGVPVELNGVEALLAACARDLPDQIAQHLAHREELLRTGGASLALFAGTANTEGVGHLLTLGVPVDALFAAGDGYYDIAPNSTALHVAAWRAWHQTVRTLLDRGANPNAVDGEGRTPLQLAVKACVSSYWSGRRKPDSIAALLQNGASASGIPVPTGYPEADALLAGS